MKYDWKLVKKLISDYQNKQQGDSGDNFFTPIFVHKNTHPVFVDDKFVKFFSDFNVESDKKNLNVTRDVRSFSFTRRAYYNAKMQKSASHHLKNSASRISIPQRKLTLIQIYDQKIQK